MTPKSRNYISEVLANPYLFCSQKPGICGKLRMYGKLSTSVQLSTPNEKKKNLLTKTSPHFSPVKASGFESERMTHSVPTVASVENIIAS